MPYVTPTTRSTGDLITAAIWNQDVVDNQTATFPLGVAGWSPYTPTLTQSATVTKTLTYCKYQRVGRTIWAQGLISCTSAGTAANSVLVGLPVTAAAAGNMACGMGYIYDASAGFAYVGLAVLQSTTVMAFQPTSADTNAFLGQAIFTAALANTDAITWSIMYEAAAGG